MKNFSQLKSEENYRVESTTPKSTYGWWVITSLKGNVTREHNVYPQVHNGSGDNS